MVTGLLAPVLLGLAGGTTDFFVLQHHRSELQATADAAVIAAAAEAGFKGWSEESAREVAAAVIGSNLSNRFSGATFDHQITVDEENRTVAIELTQDHYNYFVAGYFTGSPQIHVSATAKASGQATICLIVQAPAQAGAFRLMGGSQVRASGCSAYSNSTDTKGIMAKDTAKLTAQLACSAGGYAGTASNYSPLPLTDCPRIQDPLVARAAVVDGEFAGKGCDFRDAEFRGVKRTLSPGVYCGGLKITDGATVTFQPGIYAVRDGTLRVDGGAAIQGAGVGFAFFGEDAKLKFKNDSTISLSAPEAGPMAGILIYGQPWPGATREFKIESRNAQKLIGTVYLPSDRLTVGADQNGDGVCDPEPGGGQEEEEEEGGKKKAGEVAECVADVGTASAWTAIVAHALNVTAGVDLVLNSDYDASPVPPPAGLGPNSSRVVLQR